jgi:hypothetical protein
MENLPSVSRVVAYGQRDGHAGRWTDRNNEANGHFSQFFESSSSGSSIKKFRGCHVGFIISM